MRRTLGARGAVDQRCSLWARRATRNPPQGIPAQFGFGALFRRTTTCSDACRVEVGSERAGNDGFWRIGDRTTSPLFATSSARALDRTAAWRLLRRLAADAGLPADDRISPHSARHTYATTALDAGVALRDVQDSMDHRDPHTTRLYDRTRDATYAVAAALAS